MYKTVAEFTEISGGTFEKVHRHIKRGYLDGKIFKINGRNVLHVELNEKAEDYIEFHKTNKLNSSYDCWLLRKKNPDLIPVSEFAKEKGVSLPVLYKAIERNEIDVMRTPKDRIKMWVLPNEKSENWKEEKPIGCLSAVMQGMDRTKRENDFVGSFTRVPSHKSLNHAYKWS